jgi:hypothetical protein
MQACVILTRRKDQRYRRGYIQALVSHGIILHEEWEELRAQVDRCEPAIDMRGLPAGWRK